MIHTNQKNVYDEMTENKHTYSQSFAFLILV